MERSVWEVKQDVLDLLTLLRKAGMSAPDSDVYESEGRVEFLAETRDRSGGWFCFDERHIALILKRLSLVKITSNKEKSAWQMLHELESIEDEIRKGVFGK
jgi:hypothetical protein